MKCKKCNMEIPDGLQVCFNCGSKKESVDTHENIKKETQEQAEESVKTFEDGVARARKTVKKNIFPLKKFLLVLIPSICVIIGGIISATIYFIPEHKYDEANELLKDDEYQKAIDAFSEIVDYKNSEEMIKECKYQIAIDCVEKEDYFEAIKKLEEIRAYKSSNEKINQIQYKWGKKCFETYLYERAIEHLSACNNIEDSAKILKEAYYKHGMSLYEAGDFTTAVENLKKSENPDAKKYIEEGNFLNNLQGVWYIEMGDVRYDTFHSGVYYMNFNGWKCTEKRTYYFSDYLDNESTYDYTVKDERIMIEKNNGTDTLYFDNNNLIWISSSTDFFGEEVVEERILAKSKSVGYSEGKKHPAIGMTAEEVRNSTWGSPDDINRTVAAYGTTEQWVYGKYTTRKYIYFKNGIVTSISY